MVVQPGYVPTLSVGELDAEGAMEAELEENVQRADLSWQEKAQAIAELHALRVRQNPTHSMADTAEEVTGHRDAYYGQSTKEAILVAAQLADPDIAKAKTKEEAVKILKRKHEAANNQRLAAIIGKTFSAADHTLLKGDCLEIMATLPAASFDVILTDPPYGMGADSFGDGAGRLTGIEHHYDDSATSFRALMIKTASEVTRLAKPAAHLYLCCDIDQFTWLRDVFGIQFDWNVFRTPLINYKKGSGRVPLPEHGPRRQWECILYAYRGGKTVTAIYSDVIESEGDENLGHGAQKPIGLFSNLLRRSVRPGDAVLDPFCGTGTIFAAAHELKCMATGIEQEAAYFGISAKRLEGLK
jgi:DNA modification methylase